MFNRSEILPGSGDHLPGWNERSESEYILWFVLEGPEDRHQRQGGLPRPGRGNDALVAKLLLFLPPTRTPTHSSGDEDKL